MKKADPFSGIPAVPTSLAGQWLAFNHMANHYRKLLNVKSRVDTSAPSRMTPSVLDKVSSLSSYLKATPKPKKSTMTNKKPTTEGSKRNATKGKLVTCVQEYPVSTGDTDSMSIESSPRNPLVTNKRRLTSKSIKPKTNSCDSNAPSDYQVVFGPSSIKSSTDALGSDCDSQPDRPKVELMGVAEKIKVFLDQLHANDNRLLSSATKVSSKKPPVKPKLKQKPDAVATIETAENNSQLHQVSSRQSRHSKCFLPTESVPNSPKKVVKKKPQSTTSTLTSQSQRKLLSESISNAKKPKPRLDDSSKSKCTLGKSESRGMKSILVKADRKRYVSGGSIGSVGTIRGSDDLTTDDMLIVPLQRNRSHKEEVITMSSPKSAKTLVNSKPQQRSKTSVVLNSSKNRGSSAGYCSQSLSGKATSLSSLGIVNHNDSSRDSAYGFSSGESRIPSTRESTPEKVRTTMSTSHHHKSKSKKGADGSNSKTSLKADKAPLSTVASSANLDSADGHNDNSKVFARKKGKQGLRNEQRRVDENEDKYLNFLTEVTQDIVNRGIYTNKGLKVLFHSHIDNHTDLEFDKMDHMLEQLRTDLGIPKDDVLNKMEFGYGSVLNASKSQPYTSGQNTSKPSTIEERYYGGGSDGELFDGINEPTLNINQMILERSHHRLPEERTDGESHYNRKSSNKSYHEIQQDYNNVRSIPSDDSLSETDIRLSLKEVGIDSETTLEIVQTIQRTNRRKHEVYSGDESSDDPPTRLVNPIASTSSTRNNLYTETATIRRKSASTNRSSSGSTGSS